FAVLSHQRAVAAQKAGFFKNEILPIHTTDGVFETDQIPRPDSTYDALSKLKAVFKENGTVTAGNSSPISDGASLVLMASEHACQKYGFLKRARVLDFCVVGVDPCLMGMGPVPAIKKLLSRNNLKIEDIDFFELNEAFAAQAIACVRELKIPEDKVNLWGGAIALGHPLGCTGTRLVTTLINILERKSARLGIVSMCIGHGQGIATLIEGV
ncbi:MAG: thiolase family protein, partial [Deltaproteobacteria bacterium]|nr:thiolase family protein [Deltaproteobacteria bacterium]